MICYARGALFRRDNMLQILCFLRLAPSAPRVNRVLAHGGAAGAVADIG
jgi:hypothetical protein